MPRCKGCGRYHYYPRAICPLLPFTRPAVVGSWRQGYCLFLHHSSPTRGCRIQ
ncbi:MAG: zinc ribbon domain-containing protein [Alphaproteobacteria bacterium]